jgi:S-adenosylmethionine-diacylglycerol 3-amino-3-carboxypropyl transferase
MPLNSQLQFAITREDPDLEIEIIKHFELKNILAVCSGGDTLLILKNQFPHLCITAFDFNIHQIEHFRKKLRHLKTEEGNFESLFSCWRRFINEFVLSPQETNQMFLKGVPKINSLIQNPYWSVSFDLHFHDTFLRTMFGDSAIQHAPPGSYPRYFQQAIERGLANKNFHLNLFLQHIFLGDFITKPEYLNRFYDLSDFDLIHGNLDNVKQLYDFDLIQLSNIFDWTSVDQIKKDCLRLNQEMKKNSFLLIRQINNQIPLESFLTPGFTIEKALSKKLLTMDKSLFYSHIILARKL